MTKITIIALACIAMWLSFCTSKSYAGPLEVDLGFSSELKSLNEKEFLNSDSNLLENVPHERTKREANPKETAENWWKKNKTIIIWVAVAITFLVLCPCIIALIWCFCMGYEIIKCITSCLCCCCDD